MIPSNFRIEILSIRALLYAIGIKGLIQSSAPWHIQGERMITCVSSLERRWQQSSQDLG